MAVTFKDIRDSQEIRIYIEEADKSLCALGYTEHSFAHVSKVAKTASDILLSLGYDEHTADLARIAGFMHDIGNVANRIDHAQTSAVMAFRILDKMGMAPKDVARVMTAIGNHDESTAFPVNEIAAALILADKTDVRRSRVRNQKPESFDIHDRVNYAVLSSTTRLDVGEKVFLHSITVDTEISPVIDYFEIYMQRLLLCRKAAEYFKIQFRLEVNGTILC